MELISLEEKIVLLKNLLDDPNDEISLEILRLNSESEKIINSNSSVINSSNNSGYNKS